MNLQLDSWQREAYEQFLLSPNQAGRQKALEKFVPGSEDHTFLHLLNQHNKFSKDDEELYQ